MTDKILKSSNLISSEIVLKKIKFQFVCYLSLIVAIFKPYQKLSIVNEFQVLDILEDHEFSSKEKEKFIRSIIKTNPKAFLKLFIDIIEYDEKIIDSKCKFIGVQSAEKIKIEFSDFVFGEKNLNFLKLQFKQEVFSYLEQYIFDVLKDFSMEEGIFTHQESYLSLVSDLYEMLISDPYSNAPKIKLYRYIKNVCRDLIYTSDFNDLKKNSAIEALNSNISLEREITNLMESYNYIFDRFNK